MQVQTVLGPLEPADLGVTLPHEHVLFDGSCIWVDPSGESWVGPILAGGPGGASLAELAHRPVAMENLGDLLRAPHLSRDNLILSDVPMLLDELRRFSATGGRTVVDLTNYGLGRDP